MTARFAYPLAAIFALLAAPVSALALADCTRTTHISHGGEAFHRDMGEGRVMWLDWWSQEGMAHDILLVECASGEALRMRTAEENMSARAPFHKTRKAVDLIETEHQASRVFATLPRIAAALEGTAKDLAITTLFDETCACAALYAEARGTKTPFKLKDAQE